MRVADQMRIEIVHVSAAVTTAVAAPGVGGVAAVEPAVEEVQRLVGKDDVAVLTLPLQRQRRRR